MSEIMLFSKEIIGKYVIKEREASTGKLSKNIPRFTVWTLTQPYTCLGEFRTINKARALCKNPDRCELILLLQDIGVATLEISKGKIGNGLARLNEHAERCRERIEKLSNV